MKLPNHLKRQYVTLFYHFFSSEKNLDTVYLLNNTLFTPAFFSIQGYKLGLK